MIKLNYNNYEYETEIPFKAFVWSLAIKEFGFDGDLADQASNLIYEMYIAIDDIDALKLTDYILDYYKFLTETLDMVELEIRQNLLGAW